MAPFNVSQNTIAPSYLEKYLAQGQFHSTGQYFEGISSGNTKKVLLKNPAGSDKTFLVFSPKVACTGQLRVGKKFNVSIDTQGSSPDTGVTSKSTDSNSSVGEVQLAGDGEIGVVSGGNAFNEKVAGGGNGSRTPGTVAGTGLSNVLTPGNNMVLELTNESSGSADGSIDIDYLEVDSGEIESINQ
jgi:hypothetical protein